MYRREAFTATMPPSCSHSFNSNGVLDLHGCDNLTIIDSDEMSGFCISQRLGSSSELLPAEAG